MGYRRMVFGRTKVLTFEAVFDTTKTSTGSSASNQIRLPFYNAYFQPFTIKWGDGTSEFVSAASSTITHTYSVAGVYTINIIGKSFDIRFVNTGDRLKLLEIKNWGGIVLVGNVFEGCANLILTNVVGLPNLNNSTHQNLFTGCSSLTQINGLNNWDSTKFKNISNMFQNCVSFNQPLNFNTVNVTTMALMFYGCTNFNQPLNFNTSAVAAFNQMFHNCSNFNQSLSTFNVENGLALNSMLLNATAFNQDVSHFEFNKNAIMFGFLNGKASANYSATYYSALLNKMQARFVGTGRTQTNKTFDAGSIKRDASGTSARAALVADGWIITDGGL